MATNVGKPEPTPIEMKLIVFPWLKINFFILLDKVEVSSSPPSLTKSTVTLFKIFGFYKSLLSSINPAQMFVEHES